MKRKKPVFKFESPLAVCKFGEHEVISVFDFTRVCKLLNLDVMDTAKRVARKTFTLSKTYGEGFSKSEPEEFESLCNRYADWLKELSECKTNYPVTTPIVETIGIYIDNKLKGCKKYLEPIRQEFIAGLGIEDGTALESSLDSLELAMPFLRKHMSRFLNMELKRIDQEREMLMEIANENKSLLKRIKCLEAAAFRTESLAYQG